MNTQSYDLFSRVIPATGLGKFTQFPITRIFIALIFLLPISALSYFIGPELYGNLPEPYLTITARTRDVGLFLLFILAYGYFARIVEKRSPLELSGTKMFKEFGVGCILSIAIIGFMVTLMAALGFYRIDHLNSPMIVVNGIFRYGIASFLEELLFRVIIFKLVEEWAGSWIAVIVQGIIFGGMHAMNPNASISSTIYLMLSDMLLFGGGFMLTRRIWFIWGLHFYCLSLYRPL